MLAPCPDCEREVSDQARTCPHCGAPLRTMSGQQIASAVAILVVLAVVGLMIAGELRERRAFAEQTRQLEEATRARLVKHGTASAVPSATGSCARFAPPTSHRPTLPAHSRSLQPACHVGLAPTTNKASYPRKPTYPSCQRSWTLTGTGSSPERAGCVTASTEPPSHRHPDARRHAQRRSNQGR